MIIFDLQGAIIEGNVSYTVDSSLGQSTHPASLIIR